MLYQEAVIVTGAAVIGHLLRGPGALLCSLQLFQQLCQASLFLRDRPASWLNQETCKAPGLSDAKAYILFAKGVGLRLGCASGQALPLGKPFLPVMEVTEDL